MKVAVITCYHDPDYVRARSLRAALALVDDVEVIVCKNRLRGVGRYPEMIWKVLKLRFSERPDVYLLTFRGFEMLPWTALVSWPKPFIFDEFINPVEGLAEPNTQKKARHLPLGPSKALYKLFLKRAKVILADTEAHAAYASNLMGIPENRYVAIPVGTDETVFKQQPHKATNKLFEVFFYGTMLPLHGLSYVIEAAYLLRAEPGITFRLVGGGEKVSRMITAAVERGARISYKPWIPFEELPKAIARAGLCLAGPFGNTTQAQHVITGKTYQFLASAASTLIGTSKASDLFFDKENSLVVPQADAKALAAAIQWAYKNQKQLSALGVAGRKLYDAKYSTRAISAQLQVVLAKLS